MNKLKLINSIQLSSKLNTLNFIGFDEIMKFIGLSFSQDKYIRLACKNSESGSYQCAPLVAIVWKIDITSMAARVVNL